MGDEAMLARSFEFQGETFTFKAEAGRDDLLSSFDVALGYGVSESALRDHKARHASELRHGTHWVSVANVDSGPKRTMWTWRGAIRLGMFIRSGQAAAFRDRLEDLAMAELESGGASEVAALFAPLAAALAPLALIPEAMADLRAGQQLLFEEVEDVKERLDNWERRKNFGRVSIREALGACLRHEGLCPTCPPGKERQIVTGSAAHPTKSDDCEIGHADGNSSNNDPDNIILQCTFCNRRHRKKEQRKADQHLLDRWHADLLRFRQRSPSMGWASYKGARTITKAKRCRVTAPLPFGSTS